jgi:hypothetical protein
VRVVTYEGAEKLKCKPAPRFSLEKTQPFFPWGQGILARGYFLVVKGKFATAVGKDLWKH